MPGQPRLALLLSGGGARAAYQVGVLKAITEFLPPGSTSPFRIICGTSAGGINAAGLATHSDQLGKGIRYLEEIWGNFKTNQVYRTDLPGVLACALRFIGTLILGRMGRSQAVSLLDNRPLRQLLHEHLNLNRLQEMLDQGYLDALAITASGYSSGESVSFFQGAPHLDGWQRSRRIGMRTRLDVEHLMASAAIPIIFPAVRINREYFGDGAVRQLAPVSPALHLGADRVLVIGVGSQNKRKTREQVSQSPSLAQVVGHVMASSFVDALEADLERLNRVNHTISLIPEDIRHKEGFSLKPVQVFSISPPSQVIETMALRHVAALPASIRMFVTGSGATRRSGAGVLSYLLFEAEYCQALIELGYIDATSHKTQLLEFLGYGPQADRTSPQLDAAPRQTMAGTGNT